MKADLVERVGVAIRKARPGVNQQWEARCASAAIEMVIAALKEPSDGVLAAGQRAKDETGTMEVILVAMLAQAEKEFLGDD